MKEPKKSCTFRLSDRTIEQLRYISEYFSCSQADSIDTLVADFYMYLTYSGDVPASPLFDFFVAKFGRPTDFIT